MFIPDHFFQPGSEFFPIPDSNFFSIPNSGSASSNLINLTQKIVSKLSEIWSGLFIPDPVFLPIPDTGSRGQKGPGSATLPATLYHGKSEDSMSNSVGDPGCLSRIPDPEFYPFWIRISAPGSKNSNERQGWKKICCHSFFGALNFTKF